MSIAFTAEVVVAHEGISTVAFAKEEEKETETKKAKVDKQRCFLASWTCGTQISKQNASFFTTSAQLSAGFYPKPFNPPDVI